MISGLFFVLLGEAVLAASLPLLGWFLVFAIGNVAYIALVEEPSLEMQFGTAYLTYKQNVPRLVPWLSPGKWPSQGIVGARIQTRPTLAMTRPSPRSILLSPTGYPFYSEGGSWLGSSGTYQTQTVT